MLTRLGCGIKRDWLADDDAKDAGDALRPYHAQCERGEFAVGRAVDEELPVHGIPEICDQPDFALVVFLGTSS